MNFHELRRNVWVNNEKTLIDQFSKDTVVGENNGGEHGFFNYFQK